MTTLATPGARATAMTGTGLVTEPMTPSAGPADPPGTGQYSSKNTYIFVWRANNHLSGDTLEEY